MPRTSKAIAIASRNPEIRRNVMAFALPNRSNASTWEAPAVPDVLTWQRVESIGREAHSCLRHNYPRRLSHLADPSCLRGVTNTGKSHGGCNATRAVRLGFSADKHIRRTVAVDGEMLPWPPGQHSRLRRGELELWPDLVRQLSQECFVLCFFFGTCIC